jgi:transcriptional regulator with PAS, ATPase and Fis domain
VEKLRSIIERLNDRGFLKEGHLRRFFFISMAIAVSIPLYHVLFIHPLFTELLTQSEKDDGVTIAEHLASEVKLAKSEMGRTVLLEDSVNYLVAAKGHFGLEKIKVYSRTAECVFSTQADEIGYTNTGAHFQAELANGEVHAEVVGKGMNSIEGEKMRRDVVEVYVPLRKDRELLGAFEIYYDISKTSAQLDRLLHYSLGLLVALAACFVAVVTTALYKGNQSIVGRRRAEKALQDAHDTLEKRVEERTRELLRAKEQLQVEVEVRKQSEKAIEKSKSTLQGVFDAISDPLVMLDENLRIGMLNKAAIRYYRISDYQTAIGRPCYEVILENTPSALCDGCPLRDTFSGGRTMEFERQGLFDPDRIEQVTFYPTEEKPGESKSCIIRITDITEQKRAEESLRKAYSEIKSLKDRLEAENIYFRKEITTKHQFDHIIGQSNAFKYVLFRAEQVAPQNTTVLVLGETGTGKELIAAAIHRMSPRKDRPLVTVNCAALPANLIESELFGREKGAFTGADTRQVGRFELADGSTLCLDEIGELPMEVQAKLLRAIEHSEFQRLGSSSTIKVDVRIVATTNRNLEEEVRMGRFRQDLYYRLNVFPLTVPPLRQRKEDIPLLVQVFAERFARELGKEITAIPRETMKALEDYDWPGNVRELENVIERSVILCSGSVLQLADKLENPTISPSSDLRTLEDMEREQILRTLAETRWRINGVKGAAAILGLHPSTLRARMQKLGIRRPEIETSV